MIFFLEQKKWVNVIGHVATRIADSLLDVAVSLTPGIGWGRDVYEAVTGVDLLSREELDIFSRSMACLRRSDSRCR